MTATKETKMTTAAVERPSVSDDLATLAERIRDQHARIGRTRKRIEEANREQVAAAIQAGTLLADAKKRVEHGEWAAWVETNCAFSIRTAQLYMSLARESEKAQRFAHLGIAGAVGALAALSGPETGSQWAKPLKRAASRRGGRLKEPSLPSTLTWQPPPLKGKPVTRGDWEAARYDAVTPWSRRRSELIRAAFVEAVGPIARVAVELAETPEERERMETDMMALVIEAQVYVDRVLAVPWEATNGPPRDVPADPTGREA